MLKKVGKNCIRSNYTGGETAKLKRNKRNIGYV